MSNIITNVKFENQYHWKKLTWKKFVEQKIINRFCWSTIPITMVVFTYRKYHRYII